MQNSPTSPAITLRLAQLEDITRLNRLIDLSLRQLQRHDYTGPRLEAMLIHVYGVDTRLIEDHTYYIAESAGQLVGAGGWSRRKTLFGGDQAKNEKADNLLDPATDPARIRAFFVHPDWARQGIGRLIMQTFEQAARQAGFKRLELMATLNGERLYIVSGFRALERVELKLPGGIIVPLIRMSKELYTA